MQLYYIGHSSIEIESDRGLIILIDPWTEGNPALCPDYLKSLRTKKIDLILLTHGHSDHCQGVVELANHHQTPLIATWELSHLLVADGLKPELSHAMNKSGCFKLLGLEIRLTQAVHSSSYTDRRGITHYAGEPSGLLLTLEDGYTLYHAGDTALFSDMKLIGERYRPDLALLPIGDRFTMGVEDAALATQWLNPKVVIPIHYNTFEPIEVDVTLFEKAAAPFAQVIALKPGEKMRMSEKTLKKE